MNSAFFFFKKKETPSSLDVKCGKFWYWPLTFLDLLTLNCNGFIWNFKMLSEPLLASWILFPQVENTLTDTQVGWTDGSSHESCGLVSLPSPYNCLAFTCWFSHQAMYQMMDQGIVKLIFSSFIGDKCTKTGWVIYTCFQSIQVQKSSEYEWIGIPIYIVPHVTIGERSIWTFVSKVMSLFF